LLNLQKNHSTQRIEALILLPCLAEALAKAGATKVDKKAEINSRFFCLLFLYFDVL